MASGGECSRQQHVDPWGTVESGVSSVLQQQHPSSGSTEEVGGSTLAAWKTQQHQPGPDRVVPTNQRMSQIRAMR